MHRWNIMAESVLKEDYRDSLEKTLMLGGIGAGREGDDRG